MAAEVCRGDDALQAFGYAMRAFALDHSVASASLVLKTMFRTRVSPRLCALAMTRALAAYDDAGHREAALTLANTLLNSRALGAELGAAFRIVERERAKRAAALGSCTCELRSLDECISK